MLKNRIHTTAMVTLACIAMALTAPVGAQTADKTATIEAGMIEGAVSGGVLSFRGIPYAAPPLGGLRWLAPQPVKPWAGVRKATAFGHDCMQTPNSGDPLRTTPAEDCLVLSVWRPAASKPDVMLPVMVWIHGGGYVNGGSSSAVYDGRALARQGLVFVSLNYRFGRFGFFAHPALITAKEGPIGNFGYMDQLQALRWVQTNIGEFGGDPKQVTRVGESAGGASMMHLLTSPQTRGLFQRVIIMSGGGRGALVGRQMTGGTREQPSADHIDARVAKTLGIEGAGPDALAALRALPAKAVTGDLNLPSLLKEALQDAQFYSGTAMVDGTIVTAQPGEILRRAEAASVPLSIGTTALDLPLFFPPSKTDPLSSFGAEADKARAAYNPHGKRKPLEVFVAVGADLTMHEPARFAAKAMTAAGNPVWLYRFSYLAESRRAKSKGAPHASELPFLFETMAARYEKKVTAKDRQAARAFSTYFATFAQQGDPHSGDLPPWPKFDPVRFEWMDFTSAKGPVFGPEPRKGIALVERAAEAQTPSQNAPANLGGTSWQLVKFQGSDDKTLTPDDKAKYTIAFGTDGRVSARIDCNRGRGTWKSSGANRLEFGLLALTRAMCPPGSLHDRIVKDWEFVRSYIIKDGHLFLSLMADGGIYEFEPIGGSPPAAP